MESEDSDPRSTSINLSLPESFKDLRILEAPQVWRPQSTSQETPVPNDIKFFKMNERKRRRMNRCMYWSSKLPKPYHDHTNGMTSEFKLPRCLEVIEEDVSESIAEESFRFTRFRNKVSKRKEYKQKVASLKVIVGRLKHMCLEKPEMLKDEIPEETLRLFKSIQLNSK